MTFTPKSWGNFSSGGTPLNAAALIDLETRLSTYADSVGARVPAVIYPEDYGSGFGGGSTSDATSAIQAALNASSGAAPKIIYLGNPPYYFTNLTMNAYTTIQGRSMSTTSLKRITGSTGTALREKTAAEGNSSGATGVWIRDVFIDGNSTAGDGVVLGFSVPGAQLNFLSGLENMHVRDFPSGKGFYLYQNGAKSSYLWSNNNNIGIQTGGGGSLYDGVWCEGNTTNDLIAAGQGDTYLHVQIENGGGVPISILAGNNSMFGIFMGLFANQTNLISIDTASSASLFAINIFSNGFTYSNTVFHNIGSFGTGAVDHIPFWAEVSYSPGIMYNQNTFERYGIGKPDNVLTTTQAANYTLVLTDEGTVVEGTKATAQTITVPDNSTVVFPLGTLIEVVQQGAGQITLTPAPGVTIRTPSSLTTRAQYSSVALRKRAANEWVASGDLS